jgi:F0F1-type ATP synthase membrane subunit b/b'
MSDEESEEESKWYNNIFIIDIFAFLAIAGLVMYFCYPPVMMAFQTS